jgi:Raf kinase inhibitor-like YbhB/YbcL family protein
MVVQSDKAGWAAMRSRPAARHVVVAVAGAFVAVVAVVLVGCDTGDGRELADPPPGATAPPLVTTTVAPPSTQEPPSLGTEPQPGGLLLGSDAFAPGGEIPRRFTCDGDDVSPPLAWVNLPEGTVELAITVVDVDVPAGQSVHWVVTGLDPALGGLQEDEVPETAVEARNHTSEFGWFGPCPPSGETHAYVFTLYALSEPSGVPAGASGTDAIDLIATTPSTATILTGTYTGP